MNVNRDWASEIGARSLGQIPFAAQRRKHRPYAPPHIIELLQLPYRQWEGTIGPWKEHFGKGRGQVHSLDQKPPLRSCNEVEVAKALRRIRQNAFWVSAYGTTSMPAVWRPWILSMAELPSWLHRLDIAVRVHIRSHRGGMPDVVAWNEKASLRSALFVECKGPKEGFKEAQEDWVWGAIKSGVQPAQIAVSVRPF
jgi:hypothetical protein